MVIDFREVRFVGPFVFVYCIDNIRTHLGWGSRSAIVAQFDLQSAKMIEI